MWTFEESQAVHKKFGRLVDANGWFISRQKANSSVVNKAIAFLDDLFPFLDERSAVAVEDCEHGRVAFDLGDGFEVTYDNADRNTALLLHHGYRVGILKKTETMKALGTHQLDPETK